MIETIINLLKDNKSETAWASYKSVILELSRGKSVLEIGAGRRPIFTEKEINDNNISYVANDILKSELDLVTFRVEKAVFDITGDIPEEFLNRFDFVFSKMVQEHVCSGERFYGNIRRLLVNNGISLNFFPTLFHPVFIVNYILPDRISAIILQNFHHQRNANGIPKFKAHYKFCFSTTKQVERIKKCGFSEVYILPFFGQTYVKKVPLLSVIADAVDGWALNHNIKVISAFAYSIVVK